MYLFSIPSYKNNYATKVNYVVLAYLWAIIRPVYMRTCERNYTMQFYQFYIPM